MSEDIEVLRTNFRTSLVLLACAVAFIGNHAAVSLCEQYRIALSSLSKPEKRHGILFLVALCLGGVGFCGTQYVVFGSFVLSTSNDRIISLYYDPSLVIGSILVASFTTLIGLYVATTDEYFNKSKKDIMEIFIKRTSRTHTISEIKRMGKFQILFIVCTTSLHRIIAGGMITGGALCLSRYMGALSVQFPGQIEYNDGMVALSVVLSMLGITVEYWLFFRLLSVFPSMDVIRTVCSAIGLAFIACVHYIRLVDISFEYNPAAALSPTAVPSAGIIEGVLTSAILFSFVVLAYALSDLRAWLLRTSVQLQHADRALLALLTRTGDTTPSTEMSRSSASGRRLEDGKYFNAPPEVVNYTRKYLKPQNQSFAAKGHSPKPLSGFAQARPIFYDMFTETSPPAPPGDVRQFSPTHGASRAPLEDAVVALAAEALQRAEEGSPPSEPILLLPPPSSCNYNTTTATGTGAATTSATTTATLQVSSSHKVHPESSKPPL